MRIGFLGAENSWYYRDVVRAAGDHHLIVPLTFSALGSMIGEDTHMSFSGMTPLSQVDAILVRSMPPGSLEQVILRMDVLGQWSDHGGLVVNSPRSLETAIDKYLTLARLYRAGLPVPATVVCQRWEEAQVAFETLGKDVVVKPLFGGEGRGITRITDPELLDRAARMLAQLGAVLYLQQYVDHPGSDYRIFVVGEKMLGMRRSNPQDWRTNVSRGARTEPLEVTDQLAEVARRAVDAVGAEIAAVDILPDRAGKLWVLEVNAVPGWQALCKTVKMDVAQLVIHHLDQRWRDLAPAS